MSKKLKILIVAGARPSSRFGALAPRLTVSETSILRTCGAMSIASAQSPAPISA